jgi:methanogenic corrinoid protein MtbC1
MMDLSVLTQAVGDLEEEKVIKLLEEFVAANPGEAEANEVVRACQRGMAIVGELFEKEDYFIGDLIFAGELLTAAIDIVIPVLSGGNSEKLGKMVLATVEGDLHDIGKNIFKSMVEAAGFEVYDLGIDVPAGAILEKVMEVKPEIVGLSGVLTLALNSMKNTVDALKEAGLREEVKILIGGHPVTAEACRTIGADAYTSNAATGVKICQEWLKQK